jgi:hypothetical protein
VSPPPTAQAFLQIPYVASIVGREVLGIWRVSLGAVDGVADRSKKVGGGDGRSDVLFVDDLLAEDVGVAAVLGKLAQQVQVHPAQRERAASVAVEQVVQLQR